MEDEAYNVSDTFLDQKEIETVIPLRSIAISLKRIADALDYGDDNINLAELIGQIELNGRRVNVASG